MVEIDWDCLKQLRSVFLSETPQTAPDYWATRHVLEQYDATFAQRIGWKWNCVLEESVPRFSREERLAVVDWGCGTGIASRRFIEAWGAENLTQVYVFDRSSAAMQFATESIAKAYPSLPSARLARPPSEPFILLLSHVLGELGDALPADLKTLLDSAQGIFWVEPGTPALSSLLIHQREKLRGHFEFLAPCPHQNRCGLFETETPHWCHHFSEPPSEIFQDGFWNRYSRELKIDLRSLPISYLIAAKPPWVIKHDRAKDRILGRVRSYKGYLLALDCHEGGVNEVRVLERTDRSQFKGLKKGGFSQSIWGKSR